MQETKETWVQSLGWEDALEKEMATQFSILAWRNPWIEEPDRIVHGVGHDLVTKQQSSFYRLLFCCFSTTYLTLMVTYQKLIINKFYKYILLQSNLFSKNIRETKI